MITRKRRFSLFISTIALCSLTCPLLLPQTVQAQVYTLKTLVDFNDTNGNMPESVLAMDGSGSLYGTTYNGGSYNDGTIFKIAADSHTMTTFVNFNGANGAALAAGVTIDRNGNLYGTTSGGGANGGGTVFKIAAGSSTVTTLVNFDIVSNGNGPLTSLTIDDSGNLYGTTGAGTNGHGAVFKIAAGSNTMTTLATFNGLDGSLPNELALDSSGNIYGTTYQGGSNDSGGFGSVFKISAETNTLSILVDFHGPNGFLPSAGLTIDSMGNLYGTTSAGGDLSLGNNFGLGTVFKIAAGTDTFSTIANFDGVHGGKPVGGLAIDSMGNLYGTTYQNGANDDGTVFEIAAGSNTITTLADFDGTNGRQSVVGVTLDGDGNIYGTTWHGGANDDGTVFELSPTTVTVPESESVALFSSVLLISGILLYRRRKWTL